LKPMVSFLMVLLFVVPFTFGIIGVSEMQQERAEVRAIWEKMLREMKAEGYLSESVAQHYSDYLQSRGYQQSTPFFTASHTSRETRAVRPQHGQVDPSQNVVTLTVEVEPKPFIKAVSFLRTGHSTFRFTGTKISDYIPPQ